MSGLKNFLFLAFLLTTSVFSQTCSVDSSPFSSLTIPSLTGNYLLSPNNEVISGTNYGQLISVGSRIWMMGKPFKLSASYTALKNPCPQGWILPTAQDLANLISAAGSPLSAVLTNPSLFNMNTSLYYLSSTKTYPTNLNGSQSQAWNFQGLKFLLTGTVQVTAINTYFMSSSIYGFCVLKRSNESSTSGSSPIVVKGIDSYDLTKGLKYILSLNNTNILDNIWTLDGVSNRSNYLSIIPMKEGFFSLNYKIMMFDGSVVGDCRILWVRNYTGSEASTNFTLSNITNVSYPFFKYRNVGLHFNSGTAPLAPKDDGGAYIMYAEKNSMYLHVLTIDANGHQISDFNLTVSGFPFDIISVRWGWVALIKDYTNPNYLYLLGVNQDNVTVFKRTFINSNSTPTTYTPDQIIFYKDANSTPAFGMNAMFNPSSGRLSVGKNRIGVHFAHYNFFGYLSDGTRQDHTGDTLVTVNLTGQDEKLAFSWGASHSLVQDLFYNGDRFMSVALGDAYPMNIYFSSVDGFNGVSADPTTGIYNILNYKQNSTLLPDIMTGNGLGFSNGRLGKIIELIDGKTFVISYARRKSTTTYLGKTYSSNIDELGLAFFDRNLNLIKDVPLGQGAWVNQVQSCRYGRNIFISYVISNHAVSVYNNTVLDPELNIDDVQYFLLVDDQGNVITGPVQNPKNSTLPASDEIRMMADGRCAWTYVDGNNFLNFAYLTSPEQTPTSYNDVLNSQFYSGGSFYLINFFDLNQYKMGVIDSVNQTVFNMLDLGLNGYSQDDLRPLDLETNLIGQIPKKRLRRKSNSS